MSKEQNIKSFTAADIERYHQGLMSSKERHALEKAALEDPFLADALEGYANATFNVTEDIAQLKKRIDNRTGKTESYSGPACESIIVCMVESGSNGSFSSWSRAYWFINLLSTTDPQRLHRPIKMFPILQKRQILFQCSSAGNTDSIVKFDVDGHKCKCQ